jgi:hypothetical protein
MDKVMRSLVLSLGVKSSEGYLFVGWHLINYACQFPHCQAIAKKIPALHGATYVTPNWSTFTALHQNLTLKALNEIHSHGCQMLMLCKHMQKGTAREGDHGEELWICFVEEFALILS